MTAYHIDDMAHLVSQIRHKIGFEYSLQTVSGTASFLVDYNCMYADVLEFRNLWLVHQRCLPPLPHHPTIFRVCSRTIHHEVAP